MEGDYKTALAEMASIGTESKREDVLGCYSEQALRLFIFEQGESQSASAMFARLQNAVDARSEIHELERQMDKDHFVEIVTGGILISGGVDKATKFPIFWYRNGPLNKGSWGYVYGSPRARAFIRAYLYLIEMTIPPNVARLDCNQSALPLACYMDEAERGYLDFNVRLLSDVSRLLGAIGIFKTRRFVIFGAHPVFAMLLDVVKRAAPKLDMGTEFQFVQKGDLKTMVEDAEDIPEFFLNGGQGKPYLSNDRRNVWCYERCLSDENRITQKDLFNPDPWPYEEVDYKTVALKTPMLTAAPRTRPLTLETIEEDDDDDEW